MTSALEFPNESEDSGPAVIFSNTSISPGPPPMSASSTLDPSPNAAAGFESDGSGVTTVEDDGDGDGADDDDTDAAGDDDDAGEDAPQADNPIVSMAAAIPANGAGFMFPPLLNPGRMIIALSGPAI